MNKDKIEYSSMFVKEIAVKWHIEDVQQVRPDLNDDQASKVLQMIKNNHDATVGINWDTIEIASSILYPSEETGLLREEK